MNKLQLITGLIAATLIPLGLLLFETDSVAQPLQPVIKEIPPGSVRAKPEFVQGEVLVKYRETDIVETQPSERAAKIRALGKRLQKEFHVTPVTTIPMLGIQLLKLPPGESVISGINRLKGSVEFVEPNYKIYGLFGGPPHDKYWIDGPISLWGMDRIGMQNAWRDSTNVADTIVVAVLDSGIDYGHPDLHPHMWKNPGEVKGDTIDNDLNGIIDDVYGADFCWRTDPYFDPETHPTGNPMDNQVHGSAVAGVIGAVVDNPKDGGVALVDQRGYVAGVHRKAKLMALKILCDPGIGNSSVAIAVEAIEYAYTHGATVLNASWYVASGTQIGYPTGPSSSSASLKLAIEQARDHKALFVAAAGNSSTQRDNDLISIYPANYGRAGTPDYVDNVIAVAATMDKCANGLPINTNPSHPKCADGSTPSEALWQENPGGLGSHFGVHSVHIAAPGWHTYSTAPRSYGIGITFADGTSLAAPHVAGCAALLQANRAVTNPSSPYLPKDLKDVLMTNGDPMSGLSVLSGKRLNCDKAFHTDMSPPAGPTGLTVK